MMMRLIRRVTMMIVDAIAVVHQMILESDSYSEMGMIVLKDPG